MLRIIQAVADLFHKQGINRTTPDEIMQASNTGRGQFSHYFKSKEGLVHQVLHYYLEGIKTNASPVKYDIATWDDLNRWLFAHVELQKSTNMTRGCPLGTIACEVTENDELIGQDVNLLFDLIASKLAAFFIKEKAKGALSENTDEGRLADFCIATAQGAMLLGKIKRSSRPVEAAMTAAMEHLEQYARTGKRRATADRRRARSGEPPALRAFPYFAPVDLGVLQKAGRPQYFRPSAETRLRIVRVAADLFHKQGVAATSPDEIIELSATGKGQFYHYFKSKEGLLHEVLQCYFDVIKIGAAPVTYKIQSWQDLDGWFYSQVDLQRSFRMTRGCPLATIGNEVTENDELIRQDLSLILEVIESKLAAFFMKEKACGRLSAEANEEQLADFCIAIMQGGLLMSKIKRSSQTIEGAIEEALQYVRGHATGHVRAAS